MKIALLAVLVLLAGCAGRIDYPPGVQAPSAAQATQALRDALSLAAVRAIRRAAQSDGFYADRRIRIEIAPDAPSVEKRLRQAGLGARLERSVLQLNRIAEQASLQARPLFIKAITALDIDDPFDYLAGAEADAGTRELMDQAYDDIVAAYLPLIAAALDQSSARADYREIIERYNELKSGFDIDVELDPYLARRSVDGLFVLMAQEERAIRSTPSARGTREIDRVFSILD